MSTSSDMTSNPLASTVVTRACASEDFRLCWGYIDPLQLGDSIVCQHISHTNGTGNVRNYGNALDAARKIADSMTGSGKRGRPMSGDPL